MQVGAAQEQQRFLRNVDLTPAYSTSVQAVYARRAVLKTQKGVRNDRGTSFGWYAQGRIHPDIGWSAQALGRQRPALWGLGNLPPQGLARQPESTVCVAV